MRLSHPSSQAVSVYYTTAALTFAPGETSKTFAVSILGD